MKYNSRKIIVEILNSFYTKKIFLDKLIQDKICNPYIVQKDKALINEIVNGTIRWQIKNDFIIQKFINSNFSDLNLTIQNILRISVYQILFLTKIPNYAIVNEAVKLTKHFKLYKFTGFINATLKNIASNHSNISFLQNSDKLEDLEVIYSHPRWMLKRLIEQYGIDKSRQILEANNSRAKPTIRVNQIKSSANEITNFLKNNEIIFSQNENITNSFVIEKTPFNLADTDFFKDGKFIFQDISTMLCTALIPYKDNDLIIDLCAAPGGKVCYLAEKMQLNNINGKIIANDIDPRKNELIKENANRLGVNNIEYTCTDAIKFNYPQKADIILLDVPCSGFGTIRKNPDIKYLRKEKDINDLINLQRKLLSNAAGLLKDGGLLIYSTCSIDKSENEKNITWFLDNNNFLLLDARKFVAIDYCENNFLKCYQTKINDGAFAAILKKY